MPGARYFDSKDQLRRYLSAGNWFKSRERNHVQANRSLAFQFEVTV
jgi:hypothetical protein